MCRFCKSDTKNIESGTTDNMMKNADCPAIAKYYRECICLLSVQICLLFFCKVLSPCQQILPSMRHLPYFHMIIILYRFLHLHIIRDSCEKFSGAKCLKNDTAFISKPGVIIILPFTVISTAYLATNFGSSPLMQNLTSATLLKLVLRDPGKVRKP